MRFNKKTAVIAAAGLLAAAGLIYVLQTQGGGAPAAASAPPGAPAVPVAKVVMREIAPAAEFTGHLAAPDTVELRAQVSGPIIRVSVPEGGLVQRGQLLFQIDPRPFQVALDGAQAQLRQAEALLAQADVLQRQIIQLQRVRRHLQRAAACPQAEDARKCGSFRKLLRAQQRMAGG